MKSEKLKFLGSTISKIFRYLNKNVIQARIYSFMLSLSFLILSLSVGLSLVLVAGQMKLHELLRIIYKIITSL